MGLALCCGDDSAAQTPALERVLSIGVESGEPEYTFGNVGDVAFGPDGTIYMLDTINREVRVFDHDGRFLRKFGRKGEGPGEFQLPMQLVVSDSSVRVLDPSLRRQVVFTNSGQHLETTNIPREAAGFDVIFPLRHGHWLAAQAGMSVSGEVVALTSKPPAEIAREARRLRQQNPQIVAVIDRGGRVDTVFRYDHGLVQYFVPNGGVGFLSRSWGQSGSWTVSGDSMFALVDGVRGDIKVMRVTPRGAVEHRRVRVQITPQPLREVDWRKAEAVERTRRDLAPRIDLVGPLSKPQLGSALFSDDGTLWIQRVDYDPDRPAGSVLPLLLVPPDRRPESSIQLPTGFSLRAVRGRMLLGLRKTDLGVDIVEVWRY